MPTPLIDTLKMHATKSAPADAKPKAKITKPQDAKTKTQKPKKTMNKKRKACEVVDSASDDEMSKNLENDLSDEEEAQEDVINELIHVIGLKDVNGRKDTKKSNGEPSTQPKSPSESSEVSSEEEESSSESDAEGEIKVAEKRKEPRKKSTTTTFALEGSVLEKIGEKIMEESISGLTTVFTPQLRGDSLTRANRVLNKVCIAVEKQLEQDVDADEQTVIGADEMREILKKLGPEMGKAIQYADRVMKNMEKNVDLTESLKTTMSEKRFDTKVTEEASKVMHATKFDEESVPQGVYVNMESMGDLSTDSRRAVVEFVDSLQANNGREVAKLSLELGVKITKMAQKQLKSAADMIYKTIPQCYDSLKPSEEGSSQSPKKKAKIAKPVEQSESGETKTSKSTKSAESTKSTKKPADSVKKAKKAKQVKAKASESEDDASGTESAKKKLDFEAVKHVRFEDSQGTEKSESSETDKNDSEEADKNDSADTDKNDLESDKATASQESA